MFDDDGSMGDAAWQQHAPRGQLHMFPHAPFVLVARVGHFEGIILRLDLHDEVGEVLHLHVAGARAHVDAVAGVVAHAVFGDVAQGVVERLDALGRPGAGLRDALLGRQHVVHGQARIVDLHAEARLHDGLVFMAQRFGHRLDMLILGLVELVLHQARAARRRDRGHEDVDGIDAHQSGLEMGEVRFQRLQIGVGDGRGAGPARLGRARMFAGAVEGGEVDVLAGAALAQLRGDGRQAAQPLGRVELEACLGLLAIADDVDAHFHLLAHGGGDGGLGLGLHVGGVVGLLGHAREEQRGKRVRPGQAARVGGEDALGAFVEPRHVFSLKWRLIIPLLARSRAG